jgi:hypothetical protein
MLPFCVSIREGDCVVAIAPLRACRWASERPGIQRCCHGVPLIGQSTARMTLAEPKLAD